MKILIIFDSQYGNTQSIAAVIGYAAPKIAATLVEKGGELVLPAEGFIVEDKEGRLAAGEAERAKVWALLVIKSSASS